MALALVELTVLSTTQALTFGLGAVAREPYGDAVTGQIVESLSKSTPGESQPQLQSNPTGVAPVTLAKLDLKSGTRQHVYPVPQATLPSPSNSGLAVSVGFADASSASPNFPVPWQGSQNVLFVGGGTLSRAGAIRLDNTTGSAISVAQVTVDLGRPGPAFQLWSNFSIPANNSAVLTQTAANNFNTSAASPIVSCGQALSPTETRIPTITVTIAGTNYAFSDTAHVLDTGGFDSSCRGNQSLAWRPVGTTGPQQPSATLNLSSENAPHDVGTTTTFSATLTDAADQPLANAPVSLNVLSGPNANTSVSAVTDSNGNANFQYSSGTQGVDTAQAVLANASTGVLISDQASTTWLSTTTCTASTPSVNATQLTYVGQTSGYYGSQLKAAALLTDGTGQPIAGQTLSFNLGGTVQKATTATNGVASLTFTPAVGPTPVSVSFAGTAQYSSAQASTTITINPKPTLLRYTGNTLLGTSGAQAVQAILTDNLGATPIANEIVTFTIGTTQVSATTDLHGVAATNITLPSNQASGAGQLAVSFAGDPNYKPSSRVVPIQIYLAMPFVVWGGNANGLKVGQYINFWGPQWESQVTGGQYFAANPSFKGWAGSANIQPCQVNATTATLTTACWQVAPGITFPPSITLPSLLEIIVSNAMTKSGSVVYGNIVCGALVQVDSTPPLGSVPTQPAYGTITAVNGNCGSVFPQPAVLTASQQQTTPVLPSQQANVNYTITNQGATNATGAVLNETFDQVAPATASNNVGTIAAGQSVTGAFQVTVPSLSARQASESSAAYETRLASSDNTLYTSSGELSFSDTYGQTYQPLDFSSFSTLQIPRLTASLSGPNCIVPGSKATYQVSSNNIGTGTASQGSATVTLPDNSTQTLPFSQILSSASFAGMVQWTSPTLQPKGTSETTAAYLSRLTTADGSAIPAANLAVTWQDSLTNAYGDVDAQFSSVSQRLPILTVAPTAPGSVLPNQPTTLNFTVSNSGGANAVQANISVTRSGAANIPVPPFSVPAGQTVNPSASWRLAAIASKGAQETDAQYLSRLQSQDNQSISLDASTTWTDSSGNVYGPTDNPFGATQILPILTIGATGPASVQSGATIAYTLNVQNVGHADAAKLNITAKLPDGTVQYPLAGTALVSGATVQTSVNFTPSSTQTSPAVATFTVSWTDAAGNSYGTESASVSTVVLAQAPSITDFNPKTGPSGTAVSILGKNLSLSGGSTTVTFAGPNNTQIPAQINFPSATQLAVIVPANAVTGLIQVSNAGGSTATAVPFTVGPQQDFQIVVSPGTGTLQQGSSTTFAIALSSQQTSFSQLASLSVAGLPAGVAGNLNPLQISAGGTAALSVDLSATNLQPGNYPFTVTATASVSGKQVQHSATATLSVIASGQTTLAGQVLSTSNQPIVGASVSLDGITVLTDAAGGFFLTGIQAGANRPLSVDGHSAFSPNATFPLIFEPVNVLAGRANVVSNPFHLPPIDTSQEVTINPTQNTVAGNVAVPGLQMTIPPGANLRMLDGTLVTRTSITPLAPDRTPAPLPATVGTNIVYTSQPGGAITDIPIPVVYPNLAGLPAGKRVELWAFDHANVLWYIYGYGDVSADGRTIAPEIDPTTNRPYGLKDFSWHFPNTGPNGNPTPDDGCPTCTGSNPVDFGTGMKIERTPVVSWGGARGGIDFSLVYTTDKAATCFYGPACPFGVGATHNWDYRIQQPVAGGPINLIAPNQLTGRQFAPNLGTGVWASTATTSLLADTITVQPSSPNYYVYRKGDGTVFNFNQGGRLISKVDRNGNATTLIYDSSGNLTQITDAVGRSLTFAYDSHNDVSSVTDPLNRTWNFAYGAGIFGTNLTSITDPARNARKFTYTGARLASVVDPNGNTIKRITYDGNGRVATQTFADGKGETYSYSLSGNVVTGATITDTKGQSRSMRFSAAGYALGTTDEAGMSKGYTRDLTLNLTKTVVGPSGAVEATRGYDVKGNMLSETDRLGNTVGYQYDPTFNQVTVKTDKLGNKTTYTYDPKGNLVSMTDALNETTTYGYDSLGQLTSITDPLGHTIQMQYDNAGNLTAVIDPLNNQTTFQYDALGRKTAAIDPLGRTTSYQYDALSRLISVTDAANATTTYTYDNNGNRTSIKDQLGNTTTMVYDAKNRLISKTDPSGNTTKYQYDAKDELIATISPMGRVISRTYDARGNLATVTDPSSGVVSYAYDNENHLISLTDQRGNTTHYSYDALYRLSGTTDPVGNSSEIAYDANGNVVQKIDRLGRATTLTYDALNRVQTINFPDASVSYTYDAAGRTTQASDSESGSLSWSYDPANRVLSETQVAGTVQYTYNTAGQRASMTAGNRPVVDYAYDSAGRLSTITQGPEVFTYSYDALSRVAGLARPNAIPTTYQYDASSRLAQIQHGVNGAIENLNYSYTPDSQITSISSLNDTPLQAKSANASTPDPANRIAQFGADNFTFDQEGETLTDTNSSTNGTAQYTWDARGRLTQVTLGNGQTVSYAYDPLGRRVSRSLNGAATQFLYDAQDVVFDLNPDGTVTDYLNGPAIDQKLRQNNPGFGPLYFLQDNLGSTVGLTSSTGGMVEREKYDSYGNSNAGAFTRYLYTGRELDSAANLYYYRARFYSSLTGRFASQDPLRFKAGGNFYRYAMDNPVSLSDPLGLCPPQQPCAPSGTAPPPGFYLNLGNSAGWVDNDVYLYEFHRGGFLDAQVQYGGSQAYANYVYGVYMAAAGYSLSATLTAANTYGAVFSHYPSSTILDPTYTHIPASNVANITQGFNDAINGTLCDVN